LRRGSTRRPNDRLSDPYFESEPEISSSQAPCTEVFRACFVPPFFTHNVPALRDTVAHLGGLKRQLERELRSGHWVVALGNGSWFFAHAPEVQQRGFAVPWYLCAPFMGDFPQVHIPPQSEVVHDGPVITGALPASMTLVMLTLLSQAFSVDFTQTCARLMQYDGNRQTVAIQAKQSALLSVTRDSVVALAIAWLEKHIDQPYDLHALAVACATSTRTLLRHFEGALQMSPLDYLHLQRCQRACFLLETTLDSIEAIANACGYTDVSAFRRIFNRNVGSTPARYRQSHAIRAPRQRWKVETKPGASSQAK
ncbi:MAG: GlxA family transcriptional regulator, partial [Burkholderiaceae bacterium]